CRSMRLEAFDGEDVRCSDPDDLSRDSVASISTVPGMADRHAVEIGPVLLLEGIAAQNEIPSGALSRPLGRDDELESVPKAASVLDRQRGVRRIPHPEVHGYRNAGHPFGVEGRVHVRIRVVRAADGDVRQSGCRLGGRYWE